jgi:hypothetical protein
MADKPSAFKSMDSLLDSIRGEQTIDTEDAWHSQSMKMIPLRYTYAIIFLSWQMYYCNPKALEETLKAMQRI